METGAGMPVHEILIIFQMYQEKQAIGVLFWLQLHRSFGYCSGRFTTTKQCVELTSMLDAVRREWQESRISLT